MIIFNNLGHTFKPTDDGFPIVWVDSSDATTYTLSGSDVLTLDNKGTLGGVMTLNGAVKFANGGFESWAVLDFIRYNLGESFLPTTSFTMSTTFDLQDVTSGSNSSRNWFSQLWSDTTDLIIHYRTNTTNLGQYIGDASTGGSIFSPYELGVNTIITSYDVVTGNIIMLNFDGTNSSFISVGFDNSVNSVVQLLSGNGYSPSNSGADNPLHEFRLYNRAMTLTQMQDLQTELNDKYTP